MNYFYESPIGTILIESHDNSITGVNFVEASKDEIVEQDLLNASAVVKQCVLELDEYFEGERKSFSVNLAYDGTPFRKTVWNALLEIPYGKTVSYKDVAIAIDNPKAVRAVGMANHNNNISIIVPCHRVVGINGNLVGYGGELWRKKWLINHEKNFAESV